MRSKFWDKDFFEKDKNRPSKTYRIRCENGSMFFEYSPYEN